MNKPNLLLIDLDKTLISIDSSRLIFKRLLNISLFCYGIFRLLRVMKREQFAQALTMETEGFFETNEVSYFVDELEAYIRQEVQDIIKLHSSECDKILVVSASPHIYVQEFAVRLGFIGVGSYFKEMHEFVHMYGLKKLEYLRCHYPKESYNYRFAISDSVSDYNLLKEFQEIYIVKNSKIVKLDSKAYVDNSATEI